MVEVTRHELVFDAEARLVDPQAEQALHDSVRRGCRDLFVLAHGWNNDPKRARTLFDGFFATIVEHLPEPARATTTTVGVIWPSIRWPDEPFPVSSSGGAARTSAEPAADVLTTLRATFTAEAQRHALDELQTLLETRPRNPQALRQFQRALAVLAAEPDARDAPEDRSDDPLFDADPEEVFAAFADLGVDAGVGGAAAFGDNWKRVWTGAREALRGASYYAMKKRAGVVGQNGLGPLVGRLAGAGPVRVHLIGHSFGARLASFALAGLPESARAQDSPVKSLTLVQGAFSHFAFATTLPFRREGGALAGMLDRVDGPVLVTHSRHDLALADHYPRASLLRGQDAAAAADRLHRWAPMGFDGAQGIAAAGRSVGAPGVRYPFQVGSVLNLDCNALIVHGDGPSGAHSDIVHSELGFAVAAAACLQQ
jgi:pimeloyl-ACP methyl ester carboxylesterase